APLVKAGANNLEITVVNSWNNRIVGDLSLPPEKRVTRTNVTVRFNENTPLLPSGLLGPVKLRSPSAVSCEL
nr:hypothetical protein [Akkermansiaceae bacterium]